MLLSQARRAIQSSGRQAGQRATAPSSRVITRVNRQHLEPLRAHTVILFSAFSAIFNYMAYSTLNKKGFVLEDLIQLQANVSVLSTFKVEWAKL